MSFCNDFQQDQPAQSDFCSLDFCDDLGFPGSELSVDAPSNYQHVQHDAANISSAGLIEGPNFPRSQIFDLQDLTKPTLEVLDAIDNPTIRRSEDRVRSNEIKLVDDNAVRTLDVEQEGDFTTFSFDSRNSTLYSHNPNPSSAYDWNADYGGHKKCRVKSKVSAHEDLCSFYEECTAPSEFDTVLMSEVDHPLDIAWLSDRCDGDVHLLVAVLETFCEQGSTHCSHIRSAVLRGDLNKLCFHTVSKPCISTFGARLRCAQALLLPGLPPRLGAQRGRARARAARRGPRRLPPAPRARACCARHSLWTSGAGRCCRAGGRGGGRVRGGVQLLEGAASTA